MNKDIYNFTMKLSKQFHIYFCQFNKYDKLTKGEYVETKINALIIQCAHMYFDKEKFSYKQMFILVKETEFLIRDLYRCRVLSKKQNVVLSKILANLSSKIKLNMV